ncbi:MAG: alpha-amylase family glycosyl hydrolase [Kiritimatiellia bacterium]
MNFSKILLGVMLLAAPALGMDSPGTEITSSGVTFRVWAPNARTVHVVGDFNNWRATRQDQMEREPMTGLWVAHISRARPGRAYQFLINGELRRRDPYARMVSPDESKSVIYDPSAFDWSGNAPPPNDPNDLVIYEMHIGAFHDPNQTDQSPGTFYDAIDRLDELSELGVNCVCVMPVHEFNGRDSWGYNPSDLFAVEQAYGGPDGFKTFVKACHQRGIAVHLDIVHNHYGPQNLDLLQFDGTGSRDRGGIYFYDGSDTDALTPWGPRVKFSEPQVRRFIRDNAQMWLDEYHVDGFRWDSTVNIRAKNNGAEPIPEGAEMLVDINSFIRGQWPRALSIAEDSLGIGNFHGSWSYDFHHALRPVFRAARDADRDMDSVAAALSAPAGMYRVIYTDNHDEAGKINGEYRMASDVDPGHPESEKARRLCGLAAVIPLTAPGIPLIFMGNEMLMTGSFHDDQPLNWNKRKIHEGLVTLHRDLITLRRNLNGVSGALKGKTTYVPAIDNQKKTIIYWRESEERPGDQLVVALNFSGATQDTTIPFPDGGQWLTVLNTEWDRYGGPMKKPGSGIFELKGTARKVKAPLGPYSARIFARVSGTIPIPAPVAKPKSGRREDQPLMTYYQSVGMAGSMNDWNTTAWPMKLASDYVWEYTADFTGAPNMEFKLAANGAWSINWGAPAGTAIKPPCSVQLAEDGENIRIPGALSGAWTFRFNEQTMVLEISGGR